MSTTPPRSSSICTNSHRSFPLLLGIIVAMALSALILELSLVKFDVTSADLKTIEHVPHVVDTADADLEDIQDVQHVLDAAAAAGDTDMAPLASNNAFYPDTVFATDWSKKVKKSDILHEAALHRGCLKHKQSVISWEFGRTEQNEEQDFLYVVNETDPQLLEKLRQCPDFDTYVPQRLRSSGYCEDAAAYTKFLKSRMLPQWVMTHRFQDKVTKRTFTYHDLCRNTPMIFFNHFWDGIPNALDWPAAKPVYLMPNIEMYELTSEHYWRADVILCKTALCARRVRLWFKQEGNPKGARVLYTRHTTSNLALTFKAQLNASEAAARPEKNFSHVSILHTAGSSHWKGTQQVLDCWLSRPDLPPLMLHMKQERYKELFSQEYAPKVSKSKNILLHTEFLDPVAFGRLMTDASYIMCSSVHEGYGHYINQARSSRALIFTTDVAPMNELITPESGVLIEATPVAHRGHFLGGESTVAHALRGVTGYAAAFNGSEVCNAVMNMLKYTTLEEREKRADKALQQYYFDTVFFAQKMEELREFVRAQSNISRLQAFKSSILSTPT